jgi:hypothetical protein
MWRCVGPRAPEHEDRKIVQGHGNDWPLRKKVCEVFEAELILIQNYDLLLPKNLYPWPLDGRMCLPKNKALWS